MDTPNDTMWQILLVDTVPPYILKALGVVSQNRRQFLGEPDKYSVTLWMVYVAIM